jgi:hypothetical protein
MTAVTRRIAKLEEQFGTVPAEKMRLAGSNDGRWGYSYQCWEAKMEIRYSTMRGLAVLSVLTISALMSPGAHSAEISDVLTVLGPTGAIFGQVGVNEDGTIFGLNAASTGPAESLDPVLTTGTYYINQPGLANATSPFPLFLVDPGPPALISDEAGDVRVNGVLFIGFSSDSEADMILVSGGIQEAGPVDMTPFLNPTLQAQGYTATFQSDVPEPLSMGMLSGLIAIALLVGTRMKAPPK